MLQSARVSGLPPRHLSFPAAMQSIAASRLVIVASEDRVAESLMQAIRASPPEHIVGHLPGRTPPRALKRRPKPHHLLTTPRDPARAELLAEKPP